MIRINTMSFPTYFFSFRKAWRKLVHIYIILWVNCSKICITMRLNALVCEGIKLLRHICIYIYALFLSHLILSNDWIIITLYSIYKFIQIPTNQIHIFKLTLTHRNTHLHSKTQTHIHTFTCPNTLKSLTHPHTLPETHNSAHIKKPLSHTQVVCASVCIYTCVWCC